MDERYMMLRQQKIAGRFQQYTEGLQVVMSLSQFGAEVILYMTPTHTVRE